jgi:hypothetical protein
VFSHWSSQRKIELETRTVQLKKEQQQQQQQQRANKRLINLHRKLLDKTVFLIIFFLSVIMELVKRRLRQRFHRLRSKKIIIL